MANRNSAQEGPRVLLVDDDEVVLEAYAGVLTGDGYKVETVTNGAAALRVLRWISFDIVLSEIDMKGMNGIQLLDRIRSADPELPVVLMSNVPSVQVMALAVEQGALLCLFKPVEPEMLLKVVECIVRHGRVRRAKLWANEPAGITARAADPTVSLVEAFERAFESLHLVYQPIVSWSNRGVIAYEALLRSDEPTMADAPSILDAAQRLGRLPHVGRKIRDCALQPLAQLPPEAALFVHLHPSDLFDRELFSADAPLTAVASRVVLEIAESDYLRGIKDVDRRVADLRRPGFRFAIADLGATPVGLTTFALLDPDFVKLDITLVRDLHLEPRKQALVRKITAMCVELDLTVIGEGIEKREERDELASMGCDLMQGYLFARPAPAFPVPAF